MVLSTPIVDIIVASASTIIAIMSIGIYRRVDTLVERVEKHHRTLYGSEGVEGWEGLVSRVSSHEAELEEKRDE